jgi:molybdopterin/thiamine biosynthesis adenylyltransferase
MVEVNVNAEQISAMPESFFQRFDLVILIDQDYNTTNAVNKICRKHKIRFQAGGIFGWIGFAYFDFNNHTFLM